MISEATMPTIFVITVFLRIAFKIDLLRFALQCSKIKLQVLSSDAR